MEIIVSGRHLTVDNELREYVSAKLNDAINIKALKISSVRVIIENEKNRYTAEVIVNMKHSDVEAKVETYDLYDSIDQAADKVAKQIRKRLDRLQDHHKRPATRDVVGEEEAEEAEIEEEYLEEV